MKSLQIGQRFMSETEPELGLGILQSIFDKTIVIFFPATEDSRTYGLRSSPLKRVKFEIGDVIKSESGEKFKVEEVEEFEGILVYISGGNKIKEFELSGAISYHRPEERILNGTFDASGLYSLRYNTLQHKKKIHSNLMRGLLGGRVSLIHHQFYIAKKVLENPFPRVLLADEVGLGKTIEASLIIHNLLITERIERVLIIVPNTLTYQWFFELYRKFNLSFKVLNQEEYREQDRNPFYDSNLVICSMGLLKGSELAKKLVDEVNWDLLVVDEAHQLKWSIKETSEEYEIVKKISSVVPGLILLTATPEQLGLEGHFARLHLIDPNKFQNYNSFSEERKDYKKIADVVKELRDEKSCDQKNLDLLQKNLGKDFSDLRDSTKKIIDNIVDYYGTGRVFFRNTRKNIEKKFNCFPKRIVYSFPLENITKEKIEGIDEDDSCKVSFKIKVSWLIQKIEELKGKKIFLVCRSKRKITKLEKVLRESIFDIKIAMFHSDLSLMGRDRQAAYFADPNGAQILLCTEVGSEGRNFEFAHHLIMFDLPGNPDMLEQRIGRLDRIGQKSDIYILVPFVENTWEEILFRWYNDGISGFEQTINGGEQIYNLTKDQLADAINNSELYFKNKREKLNDLINLTKVEYKKNLEILEQGRDLIVETNSFNDEVSTGLINSVEENDHSPELENYMDQVFNNLGVDVEDIDHESIFIKPSDNMYIPHFPCLDKDGFTLTYERSKALDREDFTFITWDHPMVSGVIDLVMSSELGNATVLKWKDPKVKKIIIEFMYVFRCNKVKGIETDRFFPPRIMRVMVDSNGKNFTDKYSKEEMDEKIIELSMKERSMFKINNPESVKIPQKIAKEEIEKQVIKIKKEYAKKIENFHKDEISRLEMFIEDNSNFDDEIKMLSSNSIRLLDALENSEFYLDSLRLIV